MKLENALTTNGWSEAIAKRSSPAKFNSSQHNKIDIINHGLLLFKLVGHTTLLIVASLCFFFSNFSGRKKDAHFNHSFKHLQEYKIQHFPGYRLSSAAGSGKGEERTCRWRRGVAKIQQAAHFLPSLIFLLNP